MPARPVRLVAMLVLGALMLAGAAQAKRAPQLSEREAITAALPAFLRNEPVGCVWLDVSVSNNGKYAIASTVYLNALHPPCARYASNGYWILRKIARWKIVYNGSEFPPCSLGVPRDLTRCLP
ncbi:MAG TPA: hypothetical protein VF379_01445 [Gaiellaceae bacterium]